MTKANLLFQLNVRKIQFEGEMSDLEKETKMLTLIDLLLDYINDKDIRQNVEEIAL